MSRLATILLLSLATGAVPAAAAAQQDGGYGPPAGPPPVDAGPYAGPPPFAGLRVEGIAGYDGFGRHGRSGGATYGVAAGYDMRFRNLIGGVEAEVTDSSVKDCSGDRTLADPRVCATLDRDIYVGGRIGTTITPRALVYAKAGYTNARIGATENDGDGRFGLGHANLDGVRVGAGMEYSLFGNAYAKAEYRYSNYERGFARDQVVGGFGVRF